jgi:S1-C subfamily serine protease
MSSPRPLLKTPLAEVQVLTFEGQPVHARFATLRDALAARASAAAGGLLAEPLAGAAAITWYSEGEGEALNFSGLPASRVDSGRLRLARALRDLEPLLEDPALGPVLRLALVVPGSRAIWVLDDRVTLSEWGCLGAGAAATPAAMAAQIRDVLGPFSSLLAGVDERFFAGAPLSVFRKPAAAVAPRPAVPFAAPAAVATAAASAALPPTQPAAPPRAAPPLWVLPLVTLAALAFLLLGFWLAWNAFARDIAARRIEVPLIDEAATERALQAQRDTNAALDQELERVRRALAVPDVCTATGPLELAPPPERRPVPPAAVPPAAPPLPGQPPAGPINSLGQLLERATVMVVTINPGGTLGHGSGFFIGPDTVLTNAHVAENGVGGRVFVTSATLARAIPAQIGALTRGPGGGNVQPGMSDLAVLRLAEPVAGAQPLALTTQSERLTDVVAAGYPSAVVQQETEMRSFIDDLARGRLQRPPELVLTRGAITSIQQLPTGPTVIPHSADISAGNSGGPLVDNCGRVVGINTFVTRGTAFAGSVKYAQKVDSILPWLQQNGIAVATRTDACQPLAPGLPATPQAAAPAAPAAPTAAAPQTTPGSR